MIITDISLQRNKKRFNIFLDHEFAFGISDELRFKYNLEVGNKIDKDFIEDILKAEELIKAKTKAFQLLSYRQRSKKEIHDSLIKSGYDEDVVLDTIEYLKRENFLNDEIFTESFIMDKKNLNKFGPIRIKNELKFKGIDESLIKEKLDSLFDQEEKFEIATRLAEKRISSYKNDTIEAKQRKLSNFLLRKGYDFDVVNKVVADLLHVR